MKYRLNSSAGRAALTKPVRSPAPGPDSLLQRETGRLMPLRVLTPLYVKTVVQAAKSAAWRAR